MEPELRLDKYSYNGIEVYFRVGTEDEKVLSHSFSNDIFFKEIPSFNPSAHPVILDIGAHIGTFSLLCTMKYPGASIYAYEPCLDSFQILEKNRKINNLERLQIFRMAVAGKTGTVKLFHSKENGNWGHSITMALSPSFEVVKTTSLEEIIVQNNIDFIDLIKLNCEGAEFEILFNTSRDALRKIGLGLILYHEDLDNAIGNSDRMAALFEELKFRVVRIKTSEKRGWLIVWNREKYSRTHFILRALLRRLKL